MRAFLHGRAQRLLRLMVLSNDLLKKYNDRHFNLAVELASFLDEAARTYSEFGLKDVEGRILALKAELLTARRGINPFTFQVAAGRRRELESTVSFKVLQAISGQIDSNIQQGEKEIQDGRELLVPLVLAAVQLGFIPDPRADSSNVQAIEDLWRKICAHPDVGLAAKRVALTLSFPDIVLLLEELLASLKPPSAVNSIVEISNSIGKRSARAPQR
jgi:hypothetical protein